MWQPNAKLEGINVSSCQLYYGFQGQKWLFGLRDYYRFLLRNKCHKLPINLLSGLAIDTFRCISHTSESLQNLEHNHHHLQRQNLDNQCSPYFGLVKKKAEYRIARLSFVQGKLPARAWTRLSSPVEFVTVPPVPESDWPPPRFPPTL